MQKFSCVIKLTVPFKEAVDDDEAEEIIRKALKKLQPLEVIIEDLEEQESDDGELELEEGEEYFEEESDEDEED